MSKSKKNENKNRLGLMISGNIVLYAKVFDDYTAYSMLLFGGKDENGKQKKNGFLPIRLTNDCKDIVAEYLDYDDGSVFVSVRNAFLIWEEYKTKKGKVAQPCLVITDLVIIDEDEEDEDEEDEDDEDTIVPPKKSTKKSTKKGNKK